MISFFGIELDWTNDYDLTLVLGKKAFKDIYVFVAADACPFFKKFKAETLSEKKIMDKIYYTFIPVYLSRDHHATANAFEKLVAPRHCFLTSYGKVYDEDAGLVDSDEFVALLTEAESSR